MSTDLLEQANALGTGPDANAKVAAAIPHHKELVSHLIAAWGSAARTYGELQDIAPGKSRRVDPSEIEDDGGEWVRAD